MDLQLSFFFPEALLFSLDAKRSLFFSPKQMYDIWLFSPLSKRHSAVAGP